MGSVKRKSIDEGPSNHSSPPHKQQKDDNNNEVACVHDVSYPDNYVTAPRRSTTDQDSKPTKEFPFTLDPFQSEAIKWLNARESVMESSAHTSAGKTVVESYAIAMSLTNKQIDL